MMAVKARPASAGTAYADDFYTWTQEQSARLRAGDLSRLDRENLAEEIESLGKSRLAEAIGKAYRVARLEAAKETRLAVSRFPESCPYTDQDIMDRPFAIDSEI